MLHAQTISFPKVWAAQNFLGIWDINGSHNPGQKISPNDNWQKVVDFAGRAQSANQRKQKRKNYLEQERELKLVWKIKMAVIFIVIKALEMIGKGLVRGESNAKARCQLRERSERTTTSPNPVNLRSWWTVQLIYSIAVSCSFELSF